MVYVRRVWGYADGIEINLKKTDVEDEWQTTLPPDLVDGWYAAVLYAEASTGKIGIWHGILYVANGISHLHIKEEKFTWWILPPTNLKPVLRPPRYELILQEECEYHGS